MQKRLDYGFNGYQIPATPRSSRSARGKRLFKTKACDRKTYAFELLASVAGDLLCKNDAFPSNCGSSVGRTRESVKKFDDSVDHYVKTAKLRIPDLDGSFSVSNERIKQEVLDEVKPCRLEVYDQGSSDEALSSSSRGLRHQLCHAQSDTLVEDAPARNDSASRYVSLITKCVVSPQFPVGKSVVQSVDAPESWKLELDVLQGNYGAHKGYPSDSIGSCEMKAGKKTRGCDEGNDQRISGMAKENRPGIFISEEHLDLEPRPPALVSSDSSEEVPFYVGRPPCSNLPIVQEDVKIVGKDDDENSYGCTQPSNVTLKGYCSASQWDRKFWNLLSSKTWKVTPAILINGNPHNEDVGTEPTFCSRKTNYKRQRTQRFPAAMRRRLFPWSPLSTSIESEDVSNSTNKCVYEEVAAATKRAKQAGGGVSSSIESPKSSVKSSEAKVKLSIESFMVPELFIEMPESATIGALKRTVMEVVTSILGGGLQVGVLLERKRIHDDTKTLIQAGISCDGKLEDVGFMLEPNTFHAAKQSSIDLCAPFSQETESFKRCNPLAENSVLGVDEPAAAGLLQTDACTCAESCCDQISSSANLSVKKQISNSQTLIAMPTVSMEALEVVPLHCKPRHGERVQRRIRRPFSVSEVEALVKAVEKLGTGRCVCCILNVLVLKAFLFQCILESLMRKRKERGERIRKGWAAKLTFEKLIIWINSMLQLRLYLHKEPRLPWLGGRLNRTFRWKVKSSIPGACTSGRGSFNPSLLSNKEKKRERCDCFAELHSYWSFFWYRPFRWRDVKLLAFDNANYRTYVDLKDKWKTLVHTAGISPQQRRGEPVPQDLLDRVLCVHTYWSEKPTK